MPHYRIRPGHSFRLPNGDLQDSGLIELDEGLAQLHAGKIDPDPVDPESAPDPASPGGDQSQE